MNTKRSIVAIVMTCLLAACATEPRTATDRQYLEDKSVAMLSTAQTHDPTLADVIHNSAGYAVFPSVGKGAAGIGGAYGRGVLFENHGRPGPNGTIVAYCDLSQGSIGAQLGGQEYAEIICFETQDDVNRFKNGHFAFDAQATAVALKSGAGANAKYAEGVKVFTMDEGGLMFEASIGGQNFTAVMK
jgi:lipid-binding SYLF domain-containing protein